MKGFAVIVLWVLTIILKGYVISTLWAWFMVPTLDLPVLTIIQAIGISLLWGTFAFAPTKKEIFELFNSDETSVEDIKYQSLIMAVYLSCLGFGYVYNLFM